MTIIRIKRSARLAAKAKRVSTDIKASGYLKSLSLETPKRFYINQNRGVTL